MQKISPTLIRSFEPAERLCMAVPVPTAPDAVAGVVDSLRARFLTGATRPLAWRQAQLSGLIASLREHEAEWVAALAADLGSHRYEATLLVASAVSEVEFTARNLSKWLRPKRLPTSMSLCPGSTHLVPEPYGVVCNFIPFNYPLLLGYATMVPILASGNCVLLKPSSNTPACARLLQELLPRYLDAQAVAVVCGPSSICDVILSCRFDFIFYTGSPAIGKRVQAAAAQFLTPTLLELGGKSPVFVDVNISLTVATKRLIWGKLFNGAQTCVAPDYCLVHEAVWDSFKAEIVKVVREFYGDPSQYNDNITHIINERHFDRLVGAVESCGGQTVIESFRDRERLYFGPVVVENPSLDSALMQEEIFGPILPLVKVSGVDEAIDFINQRERPLALYVLTSNGRVFDRFTAETHSGAIMQNDTIFHVSSPACPFGGIGNSGMGQYHGKYGIRALSHFKPVLTHSTFIDFAMRYPPYTDGHLSIVKKLA
jgi:aldehyde dehydrogenase (NAD+)